MVVVTVYSVTASCFSVCVLQTILITWRMILVYSSPAFFPWMWPLFTHHLSCLDSAKWGLKQDSTYWDTLQSLPLAFQINWTNMNRKYLKWSQTARFHQLRMARLSFLSLIAIRSHNNLMVVNHSMFYCHFLKFLNVFLIHMNIYLEFFTFFNFGGFFCFLFKLSQ